MLQILDIPSKLFYKKQLKCITKLAPDRSGPKDIPSIKFIGVDGHEWQDEDSPSFYNDHEAIKIVQQVRTLTGKEKQLNVMFNAFYGTNIYCKGQIVVNDSVVVTSDMINVAFYVGSAVSLQGSVSRRSLCVGILLQASPQNQEYAKRSQETQTNQCM